MQGMEFRRTFCQKKDECSICIGMALEKDGEIEEMLDKEGGDAVMSSLK